MPARRQRTGGYKRRQVRTPGGRVIQRYEEKRAGVALCASCGKPLGGVPRLRTGKIRVLPHSSKMPNRPFGGYFCPSCSREAIKQKARA